MTLEPDTLKNITRSILDCDCKGDGILTHAGDLPCPAHFHCSVDEEYRLTLLRLEYQNLRQYMVDRHGFSSHKVVDLMLKQQEDPQTPNEWVRGIQKMVRLYLSVSLEGE